MRESGPVSSQDRCGAAVWLPLEAIASQCKTDVSKLQTFLISSFWSQEVKKPGVS